MASQMYLIPLIVYDVTYSLASVAGVVYDRAIPVMKIVAHLGYLDLFGIDAEAY